MTGKFRSAWAVLVATAAAGFLATPAAGKGSAGRTSDGFEADQIVVSLRAGASIAAVNARYGTFVLDHAAGTQDYLLGTAPGVSIPQLAAAMESDSSIEFAEENDVSETAEGVQGTTPSVDRFATHQSFVTQPAYSAVHGPQAAPLAAPGSGPIIAIVDTGVDFTAPEMGGRVLLTGYDFIGDDADPSETADGLDQDADGTADEALGHGTHVAGIAILAAPSARILPVRVLDDEGRGSAFKVFQGIDYAITHGARVINLSLSLPRHSSIVAKAINRAGDAGVTVIGAVGNDGVQDLAYPADDSDVIAVAATDDLGVKLPFSNYGSGVGLCAPGLDILSSYGDLEYARWAGTSMAAPFVSGAAARLLARYADLSTGQIRSALEQSASPIDALNPSYAGDLGAGLVNLETASTIATSSRASLSIRKTTTGASWAAWEPVKAATSYDLIRGDLASVTGAGANVSLGPVVCLADNATARDTSASPETALPATGRAFFYLFRPNGPGLGASWGTSSAGMSELPASGGCAP